MMLLWIIPGVAFPTLLGWLLVSVLEGGHPVLRPMERAVFGFVFGLAVVMFCAFLANVVAGLPFTVASFLVIHGVLMIAFGIPWWRRPRSVAAVTLPREAHTPKIFTIAVWTLAAWVLLRLVTQAGITMTTPTFFDDAMDNWNLRGKVYYFDQHFTLSFPWDANPGITSYPPTVPLAKTWLSTLAGDWHEGLVNLMHVVWFCALLALLYLILRRLLTRTWALLGATVLGSLPLMLIQGMSPYGDVFMSLYLFAAVAPLYMALRSSNGDEARSWLRIAAFSIALLPFTKNEGWALYVPVLMILTLGTLWVIAKKNIISRPALLKTVLLGALFFACIAGPWIGYKMANGLAFGNAKGIDWNLQWQPGAWLAILVNTFFEGNWNLLFVLFFGLLITRWRAAFRSQLLLLSACFLIPYCTQLFAYLTTGLSQEAIRQTGYARGLVHLMPIIVMLTILLIHDIVDSGQRIENN